MSERDNNVQHFLNLIKKSKQGKFKVYLGMIAGVGKTYRMLQDAHLLQDNGVDVKIGYVETHNRKDTAVLLEGLQVIPRRKIFYKGKELEEMDVPAIIAANPEIVVIDELAHTNVEGSKNEKRWQDVMEILETGINVISAVNVQHIESFNEEVKKITGIEVSERIPDSVLARADEVVNIDLAAEDLITRLKEGKIYPKDKVDLALSNFFKSEHILRLRELALREVAGHVVRKADSESITVNIPKHMDFMVCIGSNGKAADNLIRKTSRLASFYNVEWYVLYVQTPRESWDKIDLRNQRKLIGSFKYAVELGGHVVQVKARRISEAIFEQTVKMNVSTVCMGTPDLRWYRRFTRTGNFNRLLKKLKDEKIDLIILT